MNADGFRKLFDYHISQNRKLWDKCVTQLTDDQFVQDLPYSIGSVRNQTVHMMSIDQRWFNGLQGNAAPNFLQPQAYADRDAVRSEWDAIEDDMRVYLSTLTDDVLAQPFPMLAAMANWEIMFHVINHGTDHRAQLLVMLNQFGVETFPQDYFFFARGIDV